jgi:predicted nucleic acid-binding protein
VVEVAGLRLRVLPAADSDAEELGDLAGRLRAELLSVDAVAVVPLTAEAAPEGAKGLGTLVGWLMVEFGTPDGLGSVVAAVRGWALRTRSSVELSIGGDVLKVTGATSQQQEKIIDAWLARHALGG